MKIHSYFLKALIITSILTVMLSCNFQPKKKMLVFQNYPNLKLGLSTQDFQLAMPFNVDNVSQIIQFASDEGFQFIEIRDVLAKLSSDECKAIARVAAKNKIDVIYVFNKNPLDTGYFKVFERALANTLLFPGPGILRTLAAKSEFDADPLKKGWNKEELKRLMGILDSSIAICKSKNVQFVIENFNEAFFGNDSTYMGMADLLANEKELLFQLDIGNLFRKTSRVTPDPEMVIKYLPSLGNRWVITHLKTIQGGEPQPILTDNPIPVEKIIPIIGQQNIQFVMLELAAVNDKNQCFENHKISIQFLREKGILN